MFAAPGRSRSRSTTRRRLSWPTRARPRPNRSRRRAATDDFPEALLPRTTISRVSPVPTTTAEQRRICGRRRSRSGSARKPAAGPQLRCELRPQPPAPACCAGRYGNRRPGGRSRRVHDQRVRECLQVALDVLDVGEAHLLQRAGAAGGALEYTSLSSSAAIPPRSPPPTGSTRPPAPSASTPTRRSSRGRQSKAADRGTQGSRPGPLVLGCRLLVGSGRGVRGWSDNQPGLVGDPASPLQVATAAGARCGCSCSAVGGPHVAAHLMPPPCEGV